MKKIQLFILLTSILCTSYSFGQKPVFKVLAASNHNLKGNTPITVGTILNSDEQITVGNGDYLILMYLPQEAGAVQITNPGIYSTNALAEYIETAKTTSGGKFVDYIIGEGINVFAGLNHSDDNHDHTKCASKERCTHSVAIKILMPLTCLVMNPKVVVNWLPLEGTRKYLVRITDMADQIIELHETGNTPFVLDLSTIEYPDPDFATPRVSIITIISAEDAGKYSDIVATIYEPAELKELKVKYEAFQAINSKSNTSPSLKKLYEAYFFEENEAYLDAIRCYQEAVDLQPNVKIYKIIYDLFLKRVSYESQER